MPTFICNIDEIPDPGSRGFQVQVNDEEVSIFIVHKDGQVYGYINRCPHTGANLDWQAHQFLDMDQAFIQCATHDALFEIDTGRCVSGPCVGDFLTPVRVTLDHGDDKGAIKAQL